LTELDDETQEVILAHELAHIERRDPLWQLVHQFVAAVLFFQPLNRIACREIREQAELSCDRRAADLTGRPVVLARVLTEIATWFQPYSLQAVPGVVSGACGNLSRRVSRLLEPEHYTRKVWHGLALADLLLVAVATLAPAFSAQAEVPSPPPAPAPPAPVVTLATAPPTPSALPRPAAASTTPTQLTVPRFTLLTAIPEAPIDSVPRGAVVPAESAPLPPVESVAIVPVAVALPLPPAPVVKASPTPLQERSEAEQEADADDSDDERAESEEHEAEIEASGRELRQLGVLIGETFAQANLGSQISSITVPFAQIAAQTAAQQAEIEKVIATHMTAFSSEDRAPSEEELAEFRAEMERLRAEMAPQREEIVRLQDELRDQLGPLREELQAITDKGRDDLERWREEQ
jgi:hypothetical protein